MATQQSRVIATAGATADSVVIQHCDFPAYQVEGDSLEDAAASLVQSLTQAMNDSDDDSHREVLRGAVADVRNFIERPAAG